jgi:hypothetical protein
VVTAPLADQAATRHLKLLPTHSISEHAAVSRCFTWSRPACPIGVANPGVAGLARRTNGGRGQESRPARSTQRGGSTAQLRATNRDLTHGAERVSDRTRPVPARVAGRSAPTGQRTPAAVPTTPLHGLHSAPRLDITHTEATVRKIRYPYRADDTAVRGHGGSSGPRHVPGPVSEESFCLERICEGGRRDHTRESGANPRTYPRRTPVSSAPTGTQP